MSRVDPFIPLSIQQAEAGNVEAAKDVLREFIQIVETHELMADPEASWEGLLPWCMAVYLKNCFRPIVDDKNPMDANKAFNLIAPRSGRHRGKVVTYDSRALAAVFYLLQRNGMRAEAAIDAMRGLLFASRATIQNAKSEFKAYKDSSRFDDGLLMSVAKDHLHKVQKILDSRPKNPSNSQGRRRKR